MKKDPPYRGSLRNVFDWMLRPSQSTSDVRARDICVIRSVLVRTRIMIAEGAVSATLRPMAVFRKRMKGRFRLSSRHGAAPEKAAAPTIQ